MFIRCEGTAALYEVVDIMSGQCSPAFFAVCKQLDEAKATRLQLSTPGCSLRAKKELEEKLLKESVMAVHTLVGRQTCAKPKVQASWRRVHQKLCAQASRADGKSNIAKRCVHCAVQSGAPVMRGALVA